MVCWNVGYVVNPVSRIAIVCTLNVRCNTPERLWLASRQSSRSIYCLTESVRLRRVEQRDWINGKRVGSVSTPHRAALKSRRIIRACCFSPSSPPPCQNRSLDDYRHVACIHICCPLVDPWTGVHDDPLADEDAPIRQRSGYERAHQAFRVYCVLAR